MGLVSEDTPLSDPAIKDLVFASGLSTRASAGDVSGRGIGGDVIRRSIERMNGSIRVDSEPGKGTSFTMSLPVTLSITRALLIQHRGRTLAVPLHFSERIIDAQEVTIIETAGTRRVRLDNTYLPVRTLDEVFKSSHEDTKAGPLLILRMGRQRICLQVEKVSSQEEIVVKSMGDLLTGHPLFAGATIRGNGELVLILDVPALIEGRTAPTRAAARDALPLPDFGESMNGDSAEQAQAPLGALPTANVKSAARTGAALAHSPQRQARLRVLFVDDSLSVRRVAEKALQSLGAEVTLAVDGVDALAKLQDASFDIVFTDLEMPRTHGYDLIRELRFIPAYKNLPIVVVSSRSGKKHQDQARALGANEYMTKPFSAKGLESALKRWCSEARDARTFHENPESL
jgi:chemosensory pili system protein ChpA (sensor histidine kinase/response regulator)